MTWAIAVCSVLLFFRGNPAFKLLSDIPNNTLTELEECFDTESVEESTEDVSAVIKQLIFFSMMSAFLLAGETFVCFYYLQEDPAMILSWFIIAKNIIIFIIALRLRKKESKNLVQQILSLPRWSLVIERYSYLASAIAFLIFFLIASGIIDMLIENGY
ncbi:MAG: hypothetical protein HRT89_00780 [Lentisphaeria bacterium]|nr:hypothetical protein [Lentisphaeria bacterium]